MINARKRGVINTRKRRVINTRKRGVINTRKRGVINTRIRGVLRILCCSLGLAEWTATDTTAVGYFSPDAGVVEHK